MKLALNGIKGIKSAAFYIALTVVSAIIMVLLLPPSIFLIATLGAMWVLIMYLLSQDFLDNDFHCQHERR